MKIIFLNGPSKIGKDSITNELVSEFPEIYTSMKMAKPLKRAAANLLNIGENFLEHNKDTEFYSINYECGENTDDIIEETVTYSQTIREFLIHLSEDFMKKQLGNCIFGNLAVAELIELKVNFPNLRVLVSDSGFLDECLPVIKHFGRKNCILVHLKDKDGSITFKGDSRRYIQPGIFDNNFIQLIRIENDITQTARLLHYKINAKLL